MSLSDYLENWLLTQLMAGKTFFVGYGSAGGESSFTEFSSNGYARKAYGAYTVTSTPGDDQHVTNDAAITHAAATGTQGTATHVGIWDALTAGNLLAVVSFAELGLANVSVITGTQIEYPAGKCKLQID